MFRSKNIRSYFMLIVFASVILGNGSAFSKEQLSEMELIKLEFELACELSPTCKQKVKDGKSSAGKKYVEIRKPKPGKEGTKRILDIKQGKLPKK